jgi:hypothetical protein
LSELSLHVNPIWLEESATAERLLGAVGVTVAGGNVVAVAMFEYAVLPEALKARTR